MFFPVNAAKKNSSITWIMLPNCQDGLPENFTTIFRELTTNSRTCIFLLLKFSVPADRDCLQERATVFCCQLGQGKNYKKTCLFRRDQFHSRIVFCKTQEDHNLDQVSFNLCFDLLSGSSECVLNVQI